jgi:hypothetical protein
MVRLDGNVDESVVQQIRAISSITEARLIRLPETAKAISQAT